MDSGVGEGLRRRKTSEEDTWAMGMNVWRSGVDGRDDGAWGERNFWPAGGSSVLTGRNEVGGRRMDAAGRRSRGERGEP
jgi:hypothetical protein